MGILYLFLTFLICFILVHLIKLAYVGIKSYKKPQEKKREEKPAAPPEPVYYIVEKKRARKARYNYDEPKEIKFK